PGDNSHRFVGAIGTGESIHIAGLASREVLSVQSDDEFHYRVVLPPPGEIDPEPPPGELHESTIAYWRCNIPECSGADWTGAIVTWPSWAAYQNNARAGDASRSVFATADNAPVYTYMGPWAQGC